VFRLFDRRLVIVMGKGGVGKTTVACALALSAAARGKRTLVMELHTRPRAAYLLGSDAPARYEPRQVLPSIWVCHVTPEEALLEYGLMKLRFRKLYDLVFENDLMKRLVRMVPGMNDLLLLGKVVHAESERGSRRGAWRWDTVIVDSPATGHAVSLLRLPHVILEVVKSGPLAEEARKMRDRITDPARTCLNIVTVPEETPVREAESLRRQIEGLVRAPPGYLFVNGLWPDLFNDVEERCLRAFLDGTRSSRVSVGAAARSSLVAVRRRRHQERYLDILRRRFGMSDIVVPHVFAEDFRLDALRAVAGAIEQGMAVHEAEQSSGLTPGAWAVEGGRGGI
jgi:anion-transporting  ArsA/GET3 family ATPase